MWVCCVRASLCIGYAHNIYPPLYNDASFLVYWLYYPILIEGDGVNSSGGDSDNDNDRGGGDGDGGDGDSDSDDDGGSNASNSGVSACMIGVLRPARCWPLLRWPAYLFMTGT